MCKWMTMKHAYSFTKMQELQETSVVKQCYNISHYLRGHIFFPFRITALEDKWSPNPGSLKVQLISSQLKGIFTREGKKKIAYLSPL